MALKTRDVEFFRPLWLRVLVTGGIAAWFAYETFVSHEGLWIGLTGIALVYCVWNFFLRFPGTQANIVAPENKPAGDEKTTNQSGTN